ncbi:hypothetical protein K1719_023036 [Acacia pycnantha]|nr:hypothetical protein K1719_023036 [Acacia pycnantha]
MNLGKTVCDSSRLKRQGEKPCPISLPSSIDWSLVWGKSHGHEVKNRQQLHHRVLQGQLLLFGAFTIFGRSGESCNSFRTVIMEKAGGRPRGEVWQHVKILEGGRKVKCNYCGYEFAASANRIKSHIKKDKGKGIRVCPNFPQSHNLASDNKGNSNHLKDSLLHSQGFSLHGLIDHGKSHEVGQIQGDAKYEERIQVGSSSVSNRGNGYLQVLQYVFECLSPTDKVYESGRLNLNQKEFSTLKPGTFLDSLVIDIFVEILTESEKKKATPSNCYLPVMFSTAALVCDEHNFKDFVHRHKMGENYIFDQESPEKVFIPVHTVQETHGHFYLYIFHLNKKVVEIWDSLPTFVAKTDRDETTKKLLIAMEKLFEKVTFTEFHWKMANDILLQPNRFDCGVFVINYMQQSDNYVKRDSSFQFDSQKEREDLALKLLNNDMNKEKQNLCDKARRHYAQVEKQDGNKRLRVDPSKEHFEDVEIGREMEVEYDDLEKDHGKSHEVGQIQGDAKYEERIQVGSSSVSNRGNEYLQVLQYVFEFLSPTDKVYDSGRLNLNQKEFTTLKPGTFLDSWVIDIFVEILTEGERKKATPSNWYLPVMFSTVALVYDDHNFEAFVHRHKMIENYISNQESPEKVFIPVHTGQEPHGHFFLYIFHLNKKVVEIWDSLPTSVAKTDRDETTKKLFFAMEILFKQKKGAFSDYHKEMANDIRSQDNGFDCGVFVINYMQQSDNYVKRDSSFQFDSQKEREDLALKLLNNDLNKEKQNLYDKARRHYEDVAIEMEAEFDDSNEEEDDFDEDDDFDEEDYGSENGMNIDSDKDDDGLENDLIGWQFQRDTEQIREWIEDDKVSAIGIWGMGGSGKTALASHIYDKLLEEGDIKVIWVTVSQNSIYNLQKVIARSIELDMSDEFEVKIIARKLFQAFKEMKKCVVILDDVWDHFFLKEVGFPMSDNQIKLILTTRIREVCRGMGCDQKNKIEVGHLHMVDSWALFKKTMGSYEGLSLEVKRIARKVAYECEGLPLPIVRIATSMKGINQVGEWSHMLECLKNLDNGQWEIKKWVLPVLRSSYDFLSNKVQRFFLYYTLSIGGCYDIIDYHHLIIRFVCESIDEIKKLRVQYNEGYMMLDRLKNHGMLNKFLGALAIGITKDKGKIMANAYKKLTKIPSDDQWEDDLQKAFLTGNMIKTIPDGTSFQCSQLSTLLLDGNAELNYISDDIFNNMPALKTLDLSRTRIERLPESVSNLKCLTALLLSECRKLTYIPSLSKLKQLISLDLSDTAITKAPMGLESLVKLRCLNLLPTPNLVISASVISKLINLEYLGLDVTSQVGIQGLENLEVIVAKFRDLVGTVGSCLCSVVSSYGHNNNNNPHQIEQLDISTCKDVEYLCCFSGSCPFCSSSQLVGCLSLLDLKDLKDIVSPDALLSLHQPSLFSHLTHLQIFSCDSMETLMTPKLLALLQNLRTINVCRCGKMKEIVNASGDLMALVPNHLSHPTPITLPKLTSLNLTNMPQLNFVYRGVMLCPSLQTLCVGLPQLDTIIGKFKLINQDMALLSARLCGSIIL